VIFLLKFRDAALECLHLDLGRFGGLLNSIQLNKIWAMWISAIATANPQFSVIYAPLPSFSGSPESQYRMPFGPLQDYELAH
jgi:hypothetical protein